MADQDDVVMQDDAVTSNRAKREVRMRSGRTVLFPAIEPGHYASNNGKDTAISSDKSRGEGGHEKISRSEKRHAPELVRSKKAMEWAKVLATRRAEDLAIQRNLSSQAKQKEYQKLLRKYAHRYDMRTVRKLKQAVKRTDLSFIQKQAQKAKSLDVDSLTGKKRDRAVQAIEAAAGDYTKTIQVLRRNLNNLRDTFGTQSDQYLNFKLMVETTIKDIESRVDQQMADSLGIMRLDMADLDEPESTTLPQAKVKSKTQRRKERKAARLEKIAPAIPHTVTKNAENEAVHRSDANASRDNISDELDDLDDDYDDNDDEHEEGGVPWSDLYKDCSAAAQSSEGVSVEGPEAGYLRELRLLLGEMTMQENGRLT